MLDNVHYCSCHCRISPYLELTIKLSTTNKTTAEIAALHPAAKIISSKNPSKNNLPRIYNGANDRHTQQYNKQIISDLHFVSASESRIPLKRAGILLHASMVIDTTCRFSKAMFLCCYCSIDFRIFRSIFYLSAISTPHKRCGPNNYEVRIHPLFHSSDIQRATYG